MPVDGTTIRTHFRYDSCGRRTYESYPFIGALDSAADKGTAYQYDPLDRVKLLTHPDNNTVTYAYAGSGAGDGATTYPTRNPVPTVFANPLTYHERSGAIAAKGGGASSTRRP